MSTGNEVLFADLSADPALFEGCKGDPQVVGNLKFVVWILGYWCGSLILSAYCSPYFRLKHTGKC